MVGTVRTHKVKCITCRIEFNADTDTACWCKIVPDKEESLNIESLRLRNTWYMLIVNILYIGNYFVFDAKCTDINNSCIFIFAFFLTMVNACWLNEKEKQLCVSEI